MDSLASELASFSKKTPSPTPGGENRGRGRSFAPWLGLGLALLIVLCGLPRLAQAYSINEYPIPTTNSDSRAITKGADGNLWFVETRANQIGKITPAGAVTEYPIPTASSAPLGITSGPDGNVWFTEYSGNKIGKITPAGVFTEYNSPGFTPQAITSGPDGNIWFAEFNNNKIGKITPTGVATDYTIPTASSDPYGITSGPDGNLWFAEGSGNKIGKITTAGVFTEYTIPTTNTDPFGITNGPDGNLWFVELLGNKIGKITTAGVFTEYTIPTVGSNPLSITSGPDGNLWFVENNGNKIGKITPAGVFTEYPISTFSSHPSDITSGPDGNLWFVEDNANNIGVLNPVDAATLDLSFNPTPINAGGNANLSFNLTNPNSNKALTNLSFSTTLPTGLAVGNGTVTSNSCPNSSVTASSGTDSIGVSVSSLPANTNCTIRVETTGSIAGSYPVQVVAISATEASNPTLNASATLTITAAAPNTILAQTGSGQSSRVGTNFSGPLVAKVTDSFANPVSGTTVIFNAPTSGGASGTFGGGSGQGQPTYSGTTDSSGLITTTTFSANTVAGSYVVTASVAGITNTASFALTNTAGPGVLISNGGGSGQSALVSTAFANPLIAVVTDLYNNPVGGAVVSFTVPANGASASFAGGVFTATTSANGQATSAVLTANNLTGSYSVTATVSGVNSLATFSLTNLAACNPLVVTSNLDDGSCGTLRAALIYASTNSNKAVVINLSAGSTISLTSGLTLTSGVSITTTASCGVGAGNTMLPPVTIKGAGTSSGNGLTLNVSNQLYGLWVRGFSGVQIKAPVGSHTKMQCVKASKL